MATRTHLNVTLYVQCLSCCGLPQHTQQTPGQQIKQGHDSLLTHSPNSFLLRQTINEQAIESDSIKSALLTVSQIINKPPSDIIYAHIYREICIYVKHTMHAVKRKQLRQVRGKKHNYGQETTNSMQRRLSYQSYTISPVKGNPGLQKISFIIFSYKSDPLGLVLNYIKVVFTFIMYLFQIHLILLPIYKLHLSNFIYLPIL